MKKNDDKNKENLAEFVQEPLSSILADFAPEALGVLYTKGVVSPGGDGVLDTG